MTETPLYDVWTYTDLDRAFFREHLEDWLPREIVDAHVHMVHPGHRLREKAPEMRRQYWVNELGDTIDAPTLARCVEAVFPGRKVACVALGAPSLDFDIDAGNAYVAAESRERGWHALAILRPEWNARRIEAELSRPGVIGVKPYYTLLGASAATRDAHLEASIFEFLPRHALEVLDARGAWVTLHVPRADRLGHPQNIAEVREIRRRYPRVVLVIAHLGRCFTEPHVREALPPFAADPGLYFDNSAVLNPAVHRFALETLGPRRILYGTDNPVFFMRGRRTWEGRNYINHTSHDFHFNRGRHEPPEVEARYTLYMYEALRAMRQACEELGVDRAGVEAIFRNNARGLIEGVLARKRGCA
jgi:hypothetical protein